MLTTSERKYQKTLESSLKQNNISMYIRWALCIIRLFFPYLTHWVPNTRGLVFSSPTLKCQTREVSFFRFFKHKHWKKCCAYPRKVWRLSERSIDAKLSILYTSVSIIDTNCTTMLCIFSSSHWPTGDRVARRYASPHLALICGRRKKKLSCWDPRDELSSYLLKITHTHLGHTHRCTK
jgi:hypothetical protein